MIVYMYVFVHAFMLVCMNMFKYNLCVYRTSLYIYIYALCSMQINIGLPTAAPAETGKEDIT